MGDVKRSKDGKADGVLEIPKVKKFRKKEIGGQRVVAELTPEQAERLRTLRRQLDDANATAFAHAVIFDQFAELLRMEHELPSKWSLVADTTYVVEIENAEE